MDISVWVVTLRNRLRSAKMSLSDFSHLAILAVFFSIQCCTAHWKNVIIVCLTGEQSTLQKYGVRRNRCWTSQSRNRTYRNGNRIWLDGATNARSTAHATSKTMSHERDSDVRNTLNMSHYRYIVTLLSAVVLSALSLHGE